MRNAWVTLLFLFAASGALRAEEVSVYVSLDREHSEPVLKDFERETGIRVNATYDTERTKTVGLVQRLVSEKDEPQADVYWNNEAGQTVKLKKLGLLAPYDPPNAATIPDAFRDPDRMFTGFAARARILIVNTKLVPEEDRPTSMWDLTKERWKGRTCMARPETGTTATHAAALYSLDPAMADRYFDALIRNEVVWLTGNAHVMREVAAGKYAFGWTDTDDFRVAQVKGMPVVPVYPDRGADELGVLYIPNTLMLVRGGPNPEAGKKLINWLLRAEVEHRLAKSDTAQIPVRPGVEVPDHVRRPEDVGKIMQVDFDNVADVLDDTILKVRAKFGEAAAQSEAGETANWLLIAVVAAALVLGVILWRVTREET